MANLLKLFTDFPVLNFLTYWAILLVKFLLGNTLIKINSATDFPIVGNDLFRLPDCLHQLISTFLYVFIYLSRNLTTFYHI